MLLSLSVASAVLLAPLSAERTPNEDSEHRELLKHGTCPGGCKGFGVMCALGDLVQRREPLRLMFPSVKWG